MIINTLIDTTKRKTMLRLLALVACIGFVLMSATIIYALLFGDLMAEGPVLADMPWGLVSLVDIYLGLLLFSLWVIWREEFSITGTIWVALIISLGNMISCLYILRACLDAEGNIMKFWLGARLRKL
jgi:hypothetical protein